MTPSYNTPFTTLGKGKFGRTKRPDLQGGERTYDIFISLVYLCRHGAEWGGGLAPDIQGFFAFEDLYRIHEPLREMKTDESDVMRVVDQQTVGKMRLDARLVDAKLFARTCQGHSDGTAVDFPSDPDNVYLPAPGYLVHNTGMKAL